MSTNKFYQLQSGSRGLLGVALGFGMSGVSAVSHM